MAGPGYLLRHIILFFILSFPFLGHVFPTHASPQQEKLAVFIVMDASGTLKQTDPRGARKIAADIFMHLLEPTDMVSIIEFEKDARVLLPLGPVSQKKKATEIIEKIGHEGEFTDYRKALETTLEGLKQIKENGVSKMVVFFTDGILEPDLTDSIYYPYNREYLEEMRRAKQKSEREAIRKRYTELVTPKTERIIFEELLPRFSETRGEIYSIALTDKASTNLLKDIADRTTRHPDERHFFFAESYRDLTKEFIKVLSCRRPIFIAFERDGLISGSKEEIVFLDPYIERANFNVVFDRKGGGELIDPSGKTFQPSTEIGKVFYDFSDLPFSNGTWRVRLNGEGPFTLWAMAESKIEINVEGLKRIYKCKEPVQFTVQLLSEGKTLTEKDFGSMKFVIHTTTPTGKKEEHTLLSRGGEFKFLYNPDVQGGYHLFVELKAKDKQNNEILPRPGKELFFDVERDVLISPKEIFFGNYWMGGKEVVRKIDIESCMEAETVLQSDSSNLISSNKHFIREESGRVPRISLDRITLKPGEKTTINVGLSIPKKVYRGDYKGEIRFSSRHIEPRAVTYRFHMLTFWEISKYLFLGLVVLGLFVVCYLVIIWGCLASPSGVLIPVKIPTSDLLGSIKLSQVRCGFFSRWFNWKRNRVLIKNKGGEINLPALPPNFQVELRFYRRGKAYIKNQSPRGSAHRFSVQEPDIKTAYVRGPDQSLSLKHKSIITLEGYQFRYERI